MPDSLFAFIPNPPAPATSAPAQARILKPTIQIVWDTLYGPDLGLDSSGRMVVVGRQEAWIQDGIVASITQRGAHPVFPRWFGWNIEQALQRPTRAQVESDIKAGITYAWTKCTQGRTRDVTEFTFVWSGDLVEANFRPIPQPGLGLRAPVSTLGLSF